jgi:hypothetical protein
MPVRGGRNAAVVVDGSCGTPHDLGFALGLFGAFGSSGCHENAS